MRFQRRSCIGNHSASLLKLILLISLIFFGLSTCVFRLDNSGPRLTIIQPAEAFGVGDQVVKIKYSDESDVAQVEVYIDNELTYNESPKKKAGTIEFTWSTINKEEGERILTVVATDVLNNGERVSRRFFVDKKPPEVNIIVPIDKSILTGIFIVEATASDNFGVQKLVLYLDNERICETSQPPYKFAVDSRSKPDRDYRLRVVAFDKAGNSAESWRNITISNRRPTIEIMSPRDNAKIEDLTTVVVGLSDFSRIAKVECFVDSTLISTISDPASTTLMIPLSTENFETGEHVLYAKAYDRSNQTVATSNRVKFLVSRDFVVAFRSPQSNSYVRGNVPIEINAVSKEGMGRVELYIDTISGTPITSWISPPYHYVWNSTTFTNTSTVVILFARAFDVNSSVKDASTTVFVDNQVPTITILNPKPNSLIAGSITLEASANDNLGISKVDFYLNDLFVGTVTSPPFRINNFDIGTLGDGRQSIKAIAFDLAGNRAEVRVDVNVTRELRISATPDRGDFASGVVNFELSVPSGVSVSKVDWFLSSATITTTTASPHRIQFISSQFTDGVYYLEAQVQDQLGSVFKVRRRLKIDNTKPEVSVVSPVPNSTVRGNVELLADATDNFEIRRVQFFYRQEGGTWNQIGSDVTAPPYRVLWDTGGLNAGNYGILIRAQDKADNLRDYTFNVTVVK